jgi:hypothetical protein
MVFQAGLDAMSQEGIFIGLPAQFPVMQLNQFLYFHWFTFFIIS